MLYPVDTVEVMSDRAWRITARTVLTVACLITLLCVSLFGAALRSDDAITDNLGRVNAEVIAVKWDRTIIRYSTPDGEVHIPPNGVLYPEGLREGQLVRVEYDTTSPELARVAGRTAMLTVLPLAIVLTCTWLVAGPLLWWHRRRKALVSTWLPAGT